MDDSKDDDSSDSDTSNSNEKKASPPSSPNTSSGNQPSEQGGQQKSQGTPSQAGSSTGQPQKKDAWTSVTSTINKLHYQWNNFMPSVIKLGANKTLIDNFSNSLNTLTNNIISRNKMNTFMSASNLYSYVPDFYSLYKTKTSHLIKRVRYYIRNAMLNSMISNWTAAENDTNNLKTTWSMFKSTIDQGQQSSFNKLELSIYEFEKVIHEKNQSLIDIKGRVALSNIEEIEKLQGENKDAAVPS